MPHRIPEETELAHGPVRFPILAAFRYREYRLYWLGGAFSNIGMWALVFGRLWLMHSLTESALYLGLVTTSSLGPILLFSVWGGVLADRVNRLRLVIATRALFAVLALLTGALISADVIQPWQVIALALLPGILLAFDIPSRQAMLPRLVPRERLVNAIALYSLLFSGSAIVGPGFFAPLVNLWGLDGLFYLIGGSYILTVGMMSMMKPSPHQRSNSEHGMWQGLREGFRYIQKSRLILSLIGIATIGGIFGMSFETLLPIFAERLLKGGVDTYSIMLLGLGVGGLSGTVTLAWLGNLKNSPRFLLLSGTGFGLALALFAQMTWFPVSTPTKI
ncbi:MAG: MFS transporter [Chloroflexi bacterium]|nr:MFS transporter [Chloroflexota bacterium]